MDMMDFGYRSTNPTKVKFLRAQELEIERIKSTMFHDLDSTLTAILDDATAPKELRDADVSFETPDRNFAPGRPTVNSFCSR